MTADLIITGAKILTMEGDTPRAEAIAINGDYIDAIGDAADIEALAGPDTQWIDAKGATVLPGFIESHMHLLIGGCELLNIQLDGASDPDEIRKHVRAYASEHPDLPLIMAQAPDYAVFADSPPREVLDAMLRDRPLAMMAHDHHTVWANTIALEQAGLINGLETSPGHEVVMGDDGLANGALLEPEAYSPVLRLAGQERVGLGLNTGRNPDPWPTEDEREEDLKHLKRGLDHAARHGITSIINMDGNPYLLELLSELRSRGELQVRVRVPFHFVPDMEVADLETAKAMHEKWNDDWLASGFVKFFMDGVIDSRTAFMKNDYPGQPGYRSHGRFEADRFADLATRVDAMGLQIAVHSIGDAATQRVLDGYAAARKANGDTGPRHRIEHLELVAPEDFERIGAMRITASIQPPHAPGTCGLPLEPTLTNIRRDRWEDAFAWQRLAQAGAPIALASDWPVSDISIIRGLHAATTREAWTDDVPNHRFTLNEALAGYTIGGAWAEGTDTKKGSLAKGKLADVVVLDRDIEAIPLDELDKTQIAATICGGKVSFRAG